MAWKIEFSSGGCCYGLRSQLRLRRRLPGWHSAFYRHLYLKGHRRDRVLLVNGDVMPAQPPRVTVTDRLLLAPTACGAVVILRVVKEYSTTRPEVPVQVAPVLVTATGAVVSRSCACAGRPQGPLLRGSRERHTSTFSRGGDWRRARADVSARCLGA